MSSSPTEDEDHDQGLSRLQVPDKPIIPFVEGDGTGRDIWRASVRVFGRRVLKAYGGKRMIHWMESSPGRRRSNSSSPGCPTRPVQAFTEFLWESKAR